MNNHLKKENSTVEPAKTEVKPKQVSATRAAVEQNEKPVRTTRRPNPANKNSRGENTPVATQKNVRQANQRPQTNPTKQAPGKTAPARVNNKPVQEKPKGTRTQQGNRQTLKIIPLGGLGEIGKNITYYEYGNDAIIVDCGIAFPDETMLGIDIVIPDFTYLIENQKKIRGLCITHGHEDHIGSIPYLLKHFNVPLYSRELTLGLVEGKLKEHGLLRNAKMNVVKAGDTIRLGAFHVEFINVNHSIPDACSLAITTPVGTVIQTGDFKIDFTPIAGEVINLGRFGELGKKGVLALLSDSTNAEQPGFSESEQTVGKGIDRLFVDAADKRILIATFASNVHRIQQLINSAVKYGRKVAVSGRSMENVTAKALELGYLKAPNDLLIDIDQAESMPPEKVAIITTGSQGEPMSALTRMARGDHRKITVTPNDCIILSAHPIPGNEKAVTKVINELLELGAEVAYDREYKLHVSGHAFQNELKTMLALVKPKYFLPVHGEYKHLRRHADMAVAMGIPEERIHIGSNGHVIEFNKQGMKHNTIVTAGQVLVDGLGIGDVGSIVLRDRKHLAEDGLIVVIASIDRATGKLIAGPDIVSRGFVYVREAEDMIGKTRGIAKKSIESCVKNGSREWGVLKTKVRDDIGDYLWQTTKRRPMILPVIQEI